MILSVPFTAMVVSAVVLWMLMGRRVFMDKPNERSLHQTAVPRMGGVAIMSGWLAAALLLPSDWNLVPGVLLAAGISLLDDWRGLPVWLRLAVQLMAALWCVLIWLRPDWPLPMSLILVAVVVWMCNLYNFMDGSDGLAGGMAVIGFGSYALVAWVAGDASLAALSLAIAAATVPFLLRNFHPASIFMGDAGSVSLGLLAAILGAAGWLQGIWSVWLPLLVFSPFITDATLTLLRRMARGEKFWRAHREHYYQKLVRMGWGHRGTALAEYGLMVMAAALAIGIQGLGPWTQVSAAITWLAILLLLAWRIERHWRRHPASSAA